MQTTEGRSPRAASPSRPREDQKPRTSSACSSLSPPRTPSAAAGPLDMTVYVRAAAGAPAGVAPGGRGGNASAGEVMNAPRPAAVVVADVDEVDGLPDRCV